LRGEAADLRGYQQDIDAEIVPQLALARAIARSLYRFPSLFFRLLERSSATLALYFDLIAGECGYSDIVRHLRQVWGRFDAWFDLAVSPLPRR
jgi:hypothetical protein